MSPTLASIPQRPSAAPWGCDRTRHRPIHRSSQSLRPGRTPESSMALPHPVCRIRELYQRTANERGIRLEVREGGVNGGLLLIGTDGEDGRSYRHLVPVDYYGVIRCGHSAWEHALRGQLGLWDPCFPPRASDRR